MASLATKVNGLQLPNPFVIGSGPPGTNANVIGKAFDEQTLFRAAYTFEQNTEHHKQTPDFAKVDKK